MEPYERTVIAVFCALAGIGAITLVVAGIRLMLWFGQYMQWVP